MTLRPAGLMVGALLGLAAAGVGARLVAEARAATLVAAAAAVAVCALGSLAAARTIGPKTAPEPEPAEANADADRAVLVAACIWMRDRATSPALAAHLDTALARAGIEAVDATGQRFDPAVHEAGATVAAPNPADDGIIAGTETPGYADRGRLLRHPVVTVYRGQVRA